MKKNFSFTIHTELSGKLGRTGTISTPHGDIQTPAFVTVGTKATVKALTPEQVRDAGAQVVLANTYHLYLEPGDERIKNMGGLHKAMNWKGPTMTDSGGFQVFSLGSAYGNKGMGKISNALKTDELMLADRNDGEGLPKIAHIDPNGVTFRSHTDGSAHYFTPEKSIEIQHNLGADMIFAFDECTSPHESLHYQKEALERTHRWAKRSLEYHVSKDNAETQALFGIVQGGRDETLRKESAQFLADCSVNGREFDGFGIGGSFEKEDMGKAVEWCNSILPREKPRHLLGIGEPVDLFGAVENGCDLFDCVSSTRIARNGNVYTTRGRINITNAEYRDDLSPLDSECSCYTCQNYSRSYVAHLFRAKEMLAATLASIHNLHFIIHMVDRMRKTIMSGEFDEYKKDFLGKYYNS
ncbi:MAG: tRNA guanosine(34) transglycosylase Tgt [Patescibacteria group bacterium]